MAQKQTVPLLNEQILFFSFSQKLICLRRIGFTRLWAMTSINAPACLVARNQFYRNLGPSTAEKTAYDHCATQSKQRQVTVWVTTSTHQGLSATMARGWWISVNLGNPSPTTKRPNRTERVVK
ncbi:hypothetical protein COCON_G00143740 [Conger conger]|uniref:Uncharacterized protein n=1 Tax=Conger conger TaxID=82655 RepID=A0A9Q1DBU4_CONCO|nr:hypothetical protein COCON_G00143740 [Conger conger]